jgi:hypothetical protein
MDIITAQERMKLYRERAQLVAALSKVFPAGYTAEDRNWPIVFIQLPTGQASWHIASRDMYLFDHLRYDESWKWDGHTTEEKYRRLGALTTGGHMSEIEVGKRYTVVPEGKDRSYTGGVHQVIAINSTHVQTWFDGYGNTARRVILQADEYRFIPADKFEAPILDALNNSYTVAAVPADIARKAFGIVEGDV